MVGWPAHVSFFAARLKFLLLIHINENLICYNKFTDICYHIQLLQFVCLQVPKPILHRRPAVAPPVLQRRTMWWNNTRDEHAEVSDDAHDTEDKKMEHDFEVAAGKAIALWPQPAARGLVPRVETSSPSGLVEVTQACPLRIRRYRQASDSCRGPQPACKGPQRHRASS